MRNPQLQGLWTVTRAGKAFARMECGRRERQGLSVRLEMAPVFFMVAGIRAVDRTHFPKEWQHGRSQVVILPGVLAVLTGFFQIAAHARRPEFSRSAN